MTDNRKIEKWREPPAIVRYALPPLAVAVAAIAAHWQVAWQSGEVRFAVTPGFICAALLSAWFGGMGPGFLASALSILAVDYFFVPSIYSFAVAAEYMPPFALFSLATLFVAWLSATQRNTAKSLSYTRDELDAKLRQLQTSNVSLQAEIAERTRADSALRESEARLRALVSSIDEMVFEFDGNGTYLNIWMHDETLLQKSREQLLGRRMVDVFGAERAQPYLDIIQRVLASGQPESCEFRGLTEQTWGRWFFARFSPISYPDGSCQTVCCLLRDITERKRGERFLAAQYEVTRTLADSENLEAAAPGLLRAIGVNMEWDWGALWSIDRDGGRLQCQAIWREPDLDSTRFDAASRELTFTRGQAVLGRVWDKTEPAWVVDITTDSHSLRAQPAAAIGLHGGVAFPITLAGQALGVIEFFSRKPRRSDEEQLARLSAIGSQIGQFIRRKGAEQAVHESEKRFRAMIEHSEAVLLADSKGEAFYASASVERVLGYSPEEFVVGRIAPRYLAHPDDREAAEHAFIQLLEQPGSLLVAERRLRHKNGSWQWVEVTATNLLHEPGVTAIVFNIRDIEARKHAEEALKKSEEEWRELFEHNPAMYFLIDPDGTVMTVNAFGAAQLGYTVAELVGRSVFDVFAEEDRRHVKSNMATCLKNVGRPFSWEVRKCRKDGRVLWVRENAKAVQRGDRCVVLVACEDITERKRSEDALRQSEMYLAEAQRISRTGSFGWRVATGELFWSAEMFRIFGHDTTIKPTAELVLQRTHPDDRAFVRSLLDRATSEGKDWDCKHRVLMPDQSIKHLHAAAHGVRHPTGELEYFGAVMDITASVLAEEELYRLRNEFAHVNRVMTLGELTASIAHEINQPLTAVVTDASAAVRWLDGQSPDMNEARQALARIHKNGIRAADVISHIRGLAKKSAIQMDRVDINEVILGVIAVTRSEIERNRIMLRTDLGADLPSLQGDRVQLQQVVLNLIMNAIEAMAATEARHLLVRSRLDTPQSLVVSVCDSGSGLDAQAADRLFEAFYTTKAGGMGMGLAICRSIMEAHGGRLLARPNEPRGAIFEFTLPIEQVGSMPT
jgi:PAS domain S-box-containing protein